MYTPKPEIDLYCSECNGLLLFHMEQGKIMVEPCDVCSEATFNEGYKAGEEDRPIREAIEARNAHLKFKNTY